MTVLNPTYFESSDKSVAADDTQGGVEGALREPMIDARAASLVTIVMLALLLLTRAVLG